MHVCAQTGVGFGDTGGEIAVVLGNMMCEEVEVCHTICRSCQTDADCGANGLCLTVTGLSGSFCSVFCAADYSCPCDSQCHEAYAGAPRQRPPSPAAGGNPDAAKLS